MNLIIYKMSMLYRVVFSNTLNTQRGTMFSSMLSCRNLYKKPKSRFTSYILDKYVSLIKSYEKVLEKKFPTAMKYYNVFTAGLKYLKEDIKILYTAFKKVKTEGWCSLSRKELEIYHQLPKDMLRTAPVVIIGGGVPFGGIVLVLAFCFPRQMLTHHFWSQENRNEFPLINYKKKLIYYQPVFRCMQCCLKSLEGDPLYDSMNQMLLSLENGEQPSKDLILMCKPVFEKPPYSLEFLARNHVVALLKIHNMHRGWQKRKRLEDRATLIQLMDAAIIKEGGVEVLTQDEIKWCCFFRGLNPVNMKDEDILNWLNTWVAISQEIDKTSSSLLLHCPVLLGYSQPSNWWLLNDKTN